MRMEIGMSLACFYPLEPEKVIPIARQLGIGTCEIFLNTFSELEEAYLYDLRKACDEAHLKVYSIHPFTSAIENYFFFSPYPRRIEDAVLFYERYANAAKILGASVVNIHGDRGIGLEDLEKYLECAKPLRILQEKTGIIYSFENVFYNSVNHPEFTARLRQAAPDLRFTLDIKQAYKGSQDPDLLAEAMGNSIVNFHVNDRDDAHICLLPGRGTVDYDPIFESLRNNGYQGPALIEVYRKNFDRPEEIAVAKNFLEEKVFLAK